ncbi:pimeloyl-ACP methyl ester carboxylesterase [Nitrospirillum amazonense]|uniref:Pimeloyl-ACP methyl ester carboxylesterase n=1 Tax=Nitrospirillum amazonense TaxID=28077 RepID=A0A560K2P3_9PROT|nr:alpha/beta hydrolase [Nitrospirillum amazonense]TWB77615.1 pimeloyl-ACP methyl ester carboxylesterase [Nitrospirillum amazonense]
MNQVHRLSVGAHGLSVLAAGPDPVEQAARPIIMVHGTPGSAGGWRWFLGHGPQGVSLLAPDRPGFGRSEPKQALIGLKAQAGRLTPLLSLNPANPPAILVGHSMGGPVVARLALEQPHRVAALVLVATSFDPDLEHQHPLQPWADREPWRRLLPRPLRNANRELLTIVPELRALARDLGQLRCPVVILHGTADRESPYGNVAYLQRHLTHAMVEVRTLEGAGHFLPWTRRRDVLAAIERARALCAA